MADLNRRLQSEGQSFNFFRAVSLLEEKFARFEKNGNPIDSGAIRFQSDCSIVFPSSDIKRIDTDKDESVNLQLSFMGLTGVSSPLPLYFSEYINHHETVEKPLYDFLTIFNHRIYSLFYRAWKKYYFIRNFMPDGSDSFSRKIGLLAGLYTDARGERDVHLLAYTGLLAGGCRNAEGLRVLLADMFGNIPVTIREFAPRWADIPRPAPLGVTTCLGKNAYAGTRIFDRSGKFRIVIGPLQRDRYATFQYDSDNIRQVKALAAWYVNAPLSFDIEVQLERTDLIPVELGKDTVGLGEASALGVSTIQTGIQSIIID